MEIMSHEVMRAVSTDNINLAALKFLYAVPLKPGKIQQIGRVLMPGASVWHTNLRPAAVFPAPDDRTPFTVQSFQRAVFPLDPSPEFIAAGIAMAIDHPVLVIRLPANNRRMAAIALRHFFDDPQAIKLQRFTVITAVPPYSRISNTAVGISRQNIRPQLREPTRGRISRRT
ncbi:hypothetical protein D3C77_422870 [compost metagenome]